MIGLLYFLFDRLWNLEQLLPSLNPVQSVFDRSNHWLRWVQAWKINHGSYRELLPFSLALLCPNSGFPCSDQLQSGWRTATNVLFVTECPNSWHVLTTSTVLLPLQRCYMDVITSQITDSSTVCLTDFFSSEQIRNIDAPHNWPFVMGILWWPFDSSHKGPVMRKELPCHDVIMHYLHFDFCCDMGYGETGCVLTCFILRSNAICIDFLSKHLADHLIYRVDC